MNVQLVRHGVILAMLASLSGFAPMVVRNPRMGLAAHVSGIMHALLLLGLGVPASARSDDPVVQDDPVPVPAPEARCSHDSTPSTCAYCAVESREIEQARTRDRGVDVYLVESCDRTQGDSPAR